MRIVLPSLLVLVAGTGTAQLERQHDSHEHGRADLQLAYADGQLEVTFRATGSDIVGFEHAPRDELQRSGIRSALKTLEDAAVWLAFEPAGACVFSDARARALGFKAEDANGITTGTDDNNHDHHDDHDHDIGHDGHGEFQVTLKAGCGATPTSVNVDLAGHFSQLARIRVDFLTEDHQGRTELHGGRGVVRLTP